MNWRTSGDTTFAAFSASLPNNSVVKLRGEERAVYDAARPLSRLMRGMLQAESSGGTDFNAVPASMNNPLNMRVRGQPQFQSFPTLADGVKEWKARLTSPTYAYKNTQTVEDLIAVYAPSSDNNDEAAYVRTVETVITNLPRIDGGEGPVAEQIVYGRVPRPAQIVDDFVDKPQGYGWADYGERLLLLAVVLHAVKGYAKSTGGYFRTWDSRYANGGHGYNALTDWGVCGAIDANVFGAQWDGKIMDWNDPDGRGRRRSPYASGGDGSLAPSGDGLAFINRYGTTAVNKSTEAIELSLLQNNDPVSAKMLQSVIDLVAWRIDKKARIAHTMWPKNRDGLQMTISHFEMGKSACHIPDEVFADVIDGVEGVLRRYQVVSGGSDTPAPDPEPDALYPLGMTPQLASVLWDGPDGVLTLPWTKRPFAFDPERGECQAWLQHGKAMLKPGERYDEGRWPFLATVTRRGKDKGVHLYRFSDGFVMEKLVRKAAA